MSTAPRVGAVILAAGASSRMGTNKLVLPVEGEPMVHRTVRRVLDAGYSPIVVVTGHEAACSEPLVGPVGSGLAVNITSSGASTSCTRAASCPVTTTTGL